MLRIQTRNAACSSGRAAAQAREKVSTTGFSQLWCQNQSTLDELRAAGSSESITLNSWSPGS
jgi:hypothetical protein